MGPCEASVAFSDVLGNSAAVFVSVQQDTSEQFTSRLSFNKIFADIHVISDDIKNNKQMLE